MRSSGVVVAMLMLLGASSCAVRQVSEPNCSDYGDSPSAYMVELAGRAGGITQQDRSFVCQAAVGGLAQVAFAQVAEQKGQDPAVKEFARGVVSDHVARSDLLERLATQQIGLAPPARLDPVHATLRDQLATLGGADFDRAYMRYAVADYRSVIEDFRQQASTGSEPALQRFAANQLPTLETSLLQAQRIEAQLGVIPAKSS